MAGMCKRWAFGSSENQQATGSKKEGEMKTARQVTKYEYK
jgi:hypothetical protein